MKAAKPFVSPGKWRKTVRLICLNGWGGRLHDALVDYVKEADPDVLCLQEVIRTPSAARDWLTYRDDGAELPQRANFHDDLRRALPGHVAMFCPASRGGLWDGTVRHDSLWGLATFVRGSIPVIGQRQGFVHGDFSADGYGAHPRPRTGHAVRLFDPEAHHAVTVAHMHGLRDPRGKHDTPARRVQARKMAGLVRAVARPRERLVVCGDFNVLPGSATFEVLGGLGLTDLVTTRGFTDTRTSHYAKPGRYADYMLVNDAVKVEAFDVVREPEVSDHRPLVLEFG